MNRSKMIWRTRREALTRIATAGLASIAGIAALGAMSGCSGLSGLGGRGNRGLRGNNWVGRRYFTRNTRFWGYVRRPGESWDKARLVIFNEKYKLQPDRLPETFSAHKGHGFDHNHEYQLTGTFSGNMIYDPNSDKTLPEFVLRDYKLISENPAEMFKGHHYSPYKLPPRN